MTQGPAIPGEIEPGNATYTEKGSFSFGPAFQIIGKCILPMFVVLGWLILCSLIWNTNIEIKKLRNKVGSVPTEMGKVVRMNRYAASPNAFPSYRSDDVG